jgi:ABC-type transport system involved in cytochrome c biogenesis permease subunit
LFLVGLLSRVFRSLASLQLAVFLIAIVVVVLAWATLVESQDGAAAAHSRIYDTGWFTAINVLLAVNVLCAMAIRFPWRRRQAGFLVTHGGILVLLAGCLLTQQWGVEAQLPIYEGRAAFRAYHDEEEIELGFEVYLHRFQRKLDPGASMPSHYSSLVDFLDRSQPPQVLRQNVLITLNEPVDFTDPVSGRTYRLFQSSFDGPWLPGEPEFDKLVGHARDRDQVYLSRLSINYDPGRGLKYAGSLLIVVGIAMVYFLKAKSLTGIRRSSLVLLSVLVLAAGPLRADDSGDPSDDRGDSAWTTWGAMPVFGEGRAMPMDTFARETVEVICESQTPTLALPGHPPRPFTAAELIFSWLAEPEIWATRSFLVADDRQLREEILGVPLYDSQRRRLRHVTPTEVQNSPILAQRWAELESRANHEGKNFRLSGLDKRIKALVDAYGKFRLLTFRPDPPSDAPQRFSTRVRSAAGAWRRLAGSLQGGVRVKHEDEIRRLMVDGGEALQKLIGHVHDGEYGHKTIEPIVAAFARAGDRMAARLSDSADKPLRALTADLRRQGIELQLAMYDNGETLYLAPALNPGALEANRAPSDDAAPWLSFQAMIFGSRDLLRDYPQAELKRVRKAWALAKATYLNDSEDFAGAVDGFADAVRALAEQIEPRRLKLEVQCLDQGALAATTYPPSGAMRVEVFYNRLDPFFWGWVISLAATLCLVLAVGPVERPMFWLGVVILVVAQAFTATGLGLRGYITGLVPLTGMFETVVFVALYAALLGLWFALSPLWKRAGSQKRSNAGQAPDRGSPSLGQSVLNNTPSGRLERVIERRLFVVAGAIVSFGALVLGYYAPATVMHRHIGAVAPILRDNFWLAVHVVTIMASYASAAIALILGNIALGYYLFGRYRRRTCDARHAENEPRSDIEGKSASGREAVVVRLPPAICGTLADFSYMAIQVTVLLLAAGTILGALWADKAWGRFWAWDPKEVWALISLLVYIGILHTRYIGWTADFGMILAAVLGATAVLFTWYGVNFLLGSGMHSYGSGAGGQWAVGSAVAVQWLFLAIAGGRYLAEMQGKDEG